jgi:DNA-binding HxlR family transcriptional regulator
MEYEITELGASLAPLFVALSERSVNLTRVERAGQAYDRRTQPGAT